MDGQDLSKLSLKQILEQEDGLEVEELLSIKQIHTKIKLSMKIFVEYCQRHHPFTQKLLALGLKCPMHQSNNPQQKQLTYIASDILTSDNQHLVNLFILPTASKNSADEEDEIVQELDTEDNALIQQSQKYMFLLCIFQYLDNKELDQNCVNYIAKALATLIRKKMSTYLELFLEYPNYFDRLIQISHFPSIAHLVAKMLTDDQDNLTDRAFSVKQKILPGLLKKIHREIDQYQTFEVMESLEDIFNSSRYGDYDERSSLQSMSDLLVRSDEVQFFLNSVFSSLEATVKTTAHFYTLQNATTYISLVLMRMNMDEHHDFSYTNEPQEYKPTLKYEVDALFMNFCKLLTRFDQVWEFKQVHPLFRLLPLKFLQPLTVVTKHSHFGDYYCQIPESDRSQALMNLLKIICKANLSGILLQSTTTLLEKMLNQEESIAEKEGDIVPPDHLFLAIQEYIGPIGGSIALLLEQTRSQRNCNEKGIYFRKILLLLDNYFKHNLVFKRYPSTTKLEKLFPAFNNINNHLYAQKTIVLDHPGGAKAQAVDQFRFIEKNRIILRNSSPELETYPEIVKEVDQQQVPLSKATDQVEKRSSEEINEGKDKKEDPKEQKKGADLLTKLDDKLLARKNRVKQHDTDKDYKEPQPTLQAGLQEMLPSPKSLQSEKVVSQTITPVKSKENPSRYSSPRQSLSSQQSSPCKREQTGLSFFVRHLVIY